MGWFSKLFGKHKASGGQRPSRTSTGGKRVALAAVVNPQGALVIGMFDDSSGSGSGITEKMVRDFIDKDLRRYPELRTKAAAIQEIVIVSDEPISSSAYAEDMTRCYLKHMNMNHIE